ncbi:DUF3078 domain-containing protein [Ancylomarina euxinus]|uniref:DUF3078 domain-containing protein n=1 Tax=Ancylomarina euxinus TaxID=2283627 RepID=A0A425XZ79_9BACT|nr:DUF3078 domain-containing protein [Ancylomarina euxinus]MCZ4694795.1 DUF3078 domain-containing protein [Ancylomarina euxinus]MUP15869.1 DUF3078 domain-containing protein [Ancylomarina euxinus]RRG20506.1 DUF3078 domain-containing protein [Ancylomarina euxinus]
MTRNLLFVFFALLCLNLSAQETQDTSYWKKGGMASLSFSQTSLSNWSGGGDNAISTNVQLNLFANYTKAKNAWDNTLKLEYGLLKQGDEGTRKSIDKIDFVTKYGHQASKKWYYTALLDFKSQFAKGYNYAKSETESDVKVSNFMAPAYLLLSLGMDYKPNDIFSAYLSPVTGKTTIVNDTELSDAGAFGVDPGDKVRYEFGALTKLTLKKSIAKNVDLKSTLDLFTAYSDTFGNIDVNWDLMINMKVNEFLTASINTTLVYDDDVQYVNKDGVNKGVKVQFKEILGIGLSYKF